MIAHHLCLFHNHILLPLKYVCVETMMNNMYNYNYIFVLVLYRSCVSVLRGQIFVNELKRIKIPGHPPPLLLYETMHRYILNTSITHTQDHVIACNCM